MRRRDARWLLALLGLGTLAYFTLRDYQGHIGGVAELDGYYYYVYLRSLQMDGDLEFANEYDKWGNPFRFGTTRTGHARNVFGIGPAICWAPFFAATHALVRIGRALGRPLSLEGFSRAHQIGTFYGSLLFGWLAVLLCYLMVLRLLSDARFESPAPPRSAGERFISAPLSARRKESLALWTAIGGALAGPLPYYCLTRASYSHAAAAMATSLLVLAWLRWRREMTTRRFVLLGALTGFAVLVRPACLPFVLLPLEAGVAAVWPALMRRDFRALGAPLLGAAVALLVFSPQLLMWSYLYGSPLTVPQGEGFLWWSDSAWHSTLFSPRNGLLPSAPLYALSLLGILGAAWRGLYGARWLLLVFAAFTFMGGAVHDWWGWEFSARRFTSCLPIFIYGLAVSLRFVIARLAARPRRTAAVVAGAAIVAAAIFNIAWMRDFGRRNLRWYQVRSTQGLYMTVTNGLVDRLYRAVGNPLSLPGSLAFTFRRGGSPEVYDRIDGSYLLGEVNPATNPAGKPLLHSMMGLASLRFRYNLSRDFGFPVRDGPVHYVPLRRPHGHIFLPINRPGAVTLLLRARAAQPGTRLLATFNGKRVGKGPLAHGHWSTLRLAIPAKLVERGINRLDLYHFLPRPRPVARELGGNLGKSPVDIAVVSGGLYGGRFCEIWVAGRRVSHNRKGLNVAIIDRNSGAVIDERGFDVHIHPAMFGELSRYLDRFPKGAIVAFGARGDAGRAFKQKTAAPMLARFGAKTPLWLTPNDGYAAIGVLGAPLGSAIESHVTRGHARARVGRKPPPWREVARYAAIKLR
ncbi:MAG: hypothetical protein KC503_39395 [Myxococcales bacterium]|nr:hypothetical protein [Myxococcales bacterium]